MHPATALRVAALRLVAALAPSAAHGQLRIGVIASATGPIAAVGVPQRNTAALLPKKIAGFDVEYTELHDASVPRHPISRASAARRSMARRWPRA